jgi:glyoxylase-like metal-dependent hydrolase (beta-lactamase superfamily II)/rhodanese-related sulfurtransferase
MSDADFPEPTAPVESIDPETLFEQIDAGEEVTILDVRRPSSFEEWQIDGESVEIVNEPYYNFLDGLDDDLLERIPEGDPLVVLCGEGKSSEYVASVLSEEGRDTVGLEDGMEGWARVYQTSEITRYDGPGTVLQYQRPSSGCLGYMVYHDGEAAVVDPLRAFADRYLEDAAELGVTLKYAIDTHVHADHISGVRALDDRDVEGVFPEAAVDRGVTYADDLTTAADGDTFAVGDATIEAVHTPGHTTGMTSYLVGDSVLLTGDGLFAESVARPDLEEGDEGAPEAAQLLHESLHERILTLSDDVVVAGGHTSDAATPADDGTYTATIRELEATMDALSLDDDDFVDLVLSDMPPRPANYEQIIATNLGQEAIDDAEAFELELGPNNCAASEDTLTAD